jgi:DNA/RNA endonuclease YhcR with UshA esterase domain
MRHSAPSTFASVLVGILMVLALGAASPASAHHSFAAVYNMDKAVTVKGTIVKVRLTNPHSWFYIDVKDDAGNVAHWAFEAGTPSGMIRNGYKASVIKPGDVVTVSGFHAKDPSQNMAMLRELTIADGTVFGLFGPQESPAAK